MELQGNVLIVDDELGARESMKMILKSHYNVLTAESGSKAIDLVKSNRFDVVVLDIKMDDMSGIEVLEKIKKMEPSPEVMIVTAYPAMDTVKEAMRLGAYDYIEKPFKSFDEFREAVNRGIERHTKVSRTEQLIAHLDKLSSIGQMASEILHELAAPLTGVIGYSEFLLSQQCDGIIRESLRKINAEAERCQAIIRNILSFARKSESDKSLINVNDVVLKTIDMKSNQLKVDGIELIVGLDPDLPKTLASFGGLQQVMINIINNAHHALKNHNGKRIITIRTYFDSNNIFVSFANTGPLIPQDSLELIFEPYYTTKKSENGTGLGLSICRRIMHEHNGEIRVKSGEDTGVVFTLELPIVNKE